MSEFIEVAEQLAIERKYQKIKNSDNTLVLKAEKSAGNNPQKLAQLLSTYDFIINLLGWQSKPMASFSNLVANYQASLDAKYHDDLRDVMIALEIEKRKSERKGTSLSILQQ